MVDSDKPEFRWMVQEQENGEWIYFGDKGALTAKEMVDRKMCSWRRAYSRVHRYLKQHRPVSDGSLDRWKWEQKYYLAQN